MNQKGYCFGKNRLMVFGLGCVFLFFVFLSCEKNENQSESEKKKLADPARALAEIHCRACHIYPEPELLGKNNWKTVLHNMEQEMKKQGYHIETEDWYAIQRFYLEHAPTELTGLRKELDGKAGLFTLKPLSKLPPSIKPAATLIKIDPSKKSIYLGDFERHIFVFQNGELTDTFKIGNVPIDLLPYPSNEDLDVLCVGNLMPSEDWNGELVRIERNGKQTTLIDSLIRPVHFLRQDFNGDGFEEYLISSFGATIGKVNTGDLSIFISNEHGGFRKKTIKKQTGATKSAIHDFNADGLPDVVALFSQGQELISLFINQGDFEFKETKLLEFPPVYGTNDFELTDFNRDGFMDIVSTNGDNGDQTPVFKPYHGMRIFLNDGNQTFKEEYFFPINGASKLEVGDFDKDRDTDVLVLAMYPNLGAYPQESLLFLENKKKRFSPQYLESEPTNRWLLMDSGDVDGDGDLDLVIGANRMIQSILLPPKYNEKWKNSGNPYMVIENTLGVNKVK